MAFDFDGKGMIDSTNKETDLDKYGVWVKKPPRSIEETTVLPEDFSQELVQEDAMEEPLLQEALQEPENSAIDDFESMAKEETSDLSPFMDLEDILDVDLSTEPSQQETITEGIIDVDFLDDFTNNISQNLEKIEEEFNPFPEPNPQDEPKVAMELPPEFTEESLAFMEENPLPVEDFTDAEGTPVEETGFEESHQENQEIEISVDDFLDESDEISLDEFLSDSGEVSLEPFIDTPAQEKNDILDELPMEMELTFDDDFAVKTTTDPVSQMDDSFTSENMDDFDQMFDNIVDEAEVVEEPQEAPEPVVKAAIQDIQFDEVSEFDDFLSDFSEPEPKQQEHKEEAPKDYNLTVSMDDDTLSTSEIPETDSEQENNEEILLSTPEQKEKNEKNEESSIARLEITDYTDKGYDSDDFDVDKIMAEVEDIGEKTEEIQTEQDVSSFVSSDNQQMQEESQKCITEKPEEAMEFNQNEMDQPAVSPTEELIRNIAGEIALLRNEISSLRNDFEAFKCGKNTATEETPVQEETSSGFFADDTGDDTIALSGDELSNIFNTADFTEESVEAETQLTDEDSDNGLPSMDFDSETLEEPVIDDDYFQDEDSDDFPAEIDVPTGIVAQQDQIFEEIELEEEDQGTEEIFEEEDTTESEFATDSFDVTEEQLEEYNNGDDTAESFEDLTEESITEDFVEPALDSFVEEIVESEEEVIEEPLVEEISDEPVETVFESPQWEEPEVTEEAEPVIEEITEEIVEPAVEEITEEVIEPAVEEITEEIVEPAVEEITEEVIEPAVEEITEEIVEPAVEEITEEVIEPAIEEITEEVIEPVAEELTDEPVETVFESPQWEEPAVDETRGFASNTVEESAFADDPLIIEEPVDTISVAEEELLEELAEIPVTDALEDITEVEAVEEVTEESAEEVVADEPIAETEAEDAVEVVEEPKTNNLPDDLKQDIKSVLSYMDQLLDNLPEEKIAEFARSEHFELYKKLFTEFGL